MTVGFLFNRNSLFFRFIFLSLSLSLVYLSISQAYFFISIYQFWSSFQYFFVLPFLPSFLFAYSLPNSFFPFAIFSIYHFHVIDDIFKSTQCHFLCLSLTCSCTQRNFGCVVFVSHLLRTFNTFISSLFSFFVQILEQRHDQHNT